MKVVTHSQRPDLLTEFEHMESDAFPEFMLHDPIWNGCWPQILTEFSDFQLYLLDPDTDQLAGVFNTVPFVWDGSVEDLPDSEHEVLTRSLRHRREGREPTALCGIQVAVATSHQGRGLASTALTEGRRLCKEHGLSHLIAPIRPTLKSRYPTVPFERYIDWARSDGTPFDPWIRTQVLEGAARLGVCREPMRFEGSVSDWESWTGLAFPESGGYVIGGALDLLQVDLTEDRGRLAELNVWYGFRIDPEEGA